jgi:hypothetical protein
MSKGKIVRFPSLADKLKRLAALQPAAVRAIEDYVDLVLQRLENRARRY